MSKPKMFFLGCSLAVALMLCVFATSAAAQETIIHRFADGNDGAVPTYGLVADVSGNLYGTTTAGGMGACSGGCGTIFKLIPPVTPGGTWKKHVLHYFQAASIDGAGPCCLMFYKGNLYGTAGPTIFKLVPPSATSDKWKLFVLHTFLGAGPNGNLAFDSAGNIYGTNCCDGFSDLGTIFELSPPPAPDDAWTYRVLHSFGFPFEDGRQPLSGLVSDAAGNLYGTTEYGGDDKHLCNGLGCGTVFEMIPPPTPGAVWTYTVLHRFGNHYADPPDGAFPIGGLIFDESGNLYGTTDNGSANPHYSCGTVFQMTPPSWTETVIYSFTCDSHDGTNPLSNLTIYNGILYGTTIGGGGGPCNGGCGTAFQLAPPESSGGWTETVLYRFQGGNDGEWPISNLIFGVGGALYGTTKFGGSNEACPAVYLSVGCGTVFQLIPQ